MNIIFEEIMKVKAVFINNIVFKDYSMKILTALDSNCNKTQYSDKYVLAILTFNK